MKTLRVDKKRLSIAILLFLSIQLIAQNTTGFYLSWNVDRTERSVKPSIPISKEEAKTMYAYYVEFDDLNRMRNVKFFFEGKPSNFGNFGAHELERSYFDGYFIEKFKDKDGNYVSSLGGVDKRKYLLNNEGFWVKKSNFIDGKLVSKGVEVSRVTRNIKNEIATEIQFSSKGDTIPDGNGFQIVHFDYDTNGFTKLRQNKNHHGALINGTRGYATVVFQFNQDGLFFEEQFLDEKSALFLHPQFDLAKINWREFNKYGKPARIYYIDTMGYPHQTRAYGIVTYRKNMTRESIIYYNRKGEKTTDKNGVAKSIYNYSREGKFLGKVDFDIKGNKIRR